MIVQLSLRKRPESMDNHPANQGVGRGGQVHDVCGAGQHETPCLAVSVDGRLDGQEQ